MLNHQQQQQQQMHQMNNIYMQNHQQQQYMEESSGIQSQSQIQITEKQPANEKKNTNQVLQYFEDFVKNTSSINPVELNLDSLKEFYTIKMEKLQPVDVIRSNYYKLITRQTYGKNMKKNWNDIETNLLIWIIVVACSWRKLDCRKIPEDIWEDISQMMIGRSGEQCKFKWLSLSKLNLQQIPWNQEEDNHLLQIINNYQNSDKPNKWSDIARELNSISGKNVFRAGKQCRERWNNHLDPNINRGPWSEREDLELLKLIHEKGKRWSDVSKSLKNSRTENSVKNRFNSLLKREKQSGTTEKLEAGTEDDSNQNVATSKDEATVIQSLIEKFENRIKNGLTLMHSDNQLNTLENINEEDQEDENNNQMDNEDQRYNKYGMEDQNQINQPTKAISKVKAQKNKLMGLVENEMKVKSEDQNPIQQQLQGSTLFPQFVNNGNNNQIMNNNDQQQLDPNHIPSLTNLGGNQTNLFGQQTNQAGLYLPNQQFNNTESPICMPGISPQTFYPPFQQFQNQNNGNISNTQLEDENNVQNTPGSQNKTPDSGNGTQGINNNKQINLFKTLQQNNVGSQSSLSNTSTPKQQNLPSMFSIKQTSEIKNEAEFNQLQICFVNFKTKEIFKAGTGFFQDVVQQCAEQKIQIMQQQLFQQQQLSMTGLSPMQIMTPLQQQQQQNSQQQQQFQVQQSPLLQFQSKNQSMEPSPQINNIGQKGQNSYMNFPLPNNSLQQFTNFYSQQTPPQQLQQRSFNNIMFAESPQLNGNLGKQAGNQQNQGCATNSYNILLQNQALINNNNSNSNGKQNLPLVQNLQNGSAQNGQQQNNQNMNNVQQNNNQQQSTPNQTLNNQNIPLSPYQASQIQQQLQQMKMQNNMLEIPTNQNFENLQFLQQQQSNQQLQNNNNTSNNNNQWNQYDNSQNSSQQQSQQQNQCNNNNINQYNNLDQNQQQLFQQQQVNQGLFTQ